MSQQIDFEMSSYEIRAIRLAGQNIEDDEMSDYESDKETKNTQQLSLNLRPGANTLPDTNSDAQTYKDSAPPYTMTATEQVAFGRALKDYYEKLEHWEYDYHKRSLRFQKEVLEWNSEYTGIHGDRLPFSNPEGPMPFMPMEPILPPKPVMPVPPSQDLRKLVKAAKTSNSRNSRMEPSRDYGTYQGCVDSWFPGKKVKGRIVKKREGRRAKSGGGRAEAVDRALNTLEVNVSFSSSGNGGNGGAAENAVLNFANLSMRPKFNERDMVIRDQQGGDM